MPAQQILLAKSQGSPDSGGGDCTEGTVRGVAIGKNGVLGPQGTLRHMNHIFFSRANADISITFVFLLSNLTGLLLL